jgi:hypothetical protein
VQFLWASSTQSLDSGLQAIGEIAAEGDALAAIADGGSIPAVVAHEVQIDAEVECNVALMPKEPPKISSNVQVFPVDVRLHPVALDAQLKRGEVQNLTPWASVKMYLCNSLILIYSGSATATMPWHRVGAQYIMR